MSYILDALQKSAADERPAQPPEEFPGIGLPAQNPSGGSGGLSLPWKLAIGAVLLTNVVLVFLWRAESANDNLVAQQTQAPSLSPSPAATRQLSFENPRGGQNADKIPLPGVVSPRDLPPPRSTGSNSTTQQATPSAGTRRTFKPTGRPITIASEPEPQNYRPTSPTPNPAPTPVINRQIPQPQAAPPASSRARSASALSALTTSAREALYALSFSFHIYGNESDLRSVGVNGQRTTEGQTVTTDKGKTFTIAEITDGGAIVEFEHEGETLSVAIPVMEDWKDS